MKAVISSRINHLKRKLSFFDFDELCADEKMMIQLAGDIVRYGDFSTREDVRYFRFEMKVLINLMKRIMQSQKDETCIVLKENEKWLVNPGSAQRLYSIFRKNGIKNKKTEGILIDIASEWEIIRRLSISVFQCNTSALFVLPESGLVLIPTDHMDLFVFCRNKELLEKIERIVRQSVSHKKHGSNIADVGDDSMKTVRDDAVSGRTLEDMDRAIGNFKMNKVSDPIVLSDV